MESDIHVIYIALWWLVVNELLADRFHRPLHGSVRHIYALAKENLYLLCSLVVRALVRQSRDPGSTPGGGRDEFFPSLKNKHLK